MSDMEKIIAALEDAQRQIPELVSEIERLRAAAQQARAALSDLIATRDPLVYSDALRAQEGAIGSDGMTDIVERLRADTESAEDEWALMDDAANEIENLRAASRRRALDYLALDTQAAALQEEVERLRAALADAIQASKEGWRYADELDQERRRLTAQQGEPVAWIDDATYNVELSFKPWMAGDDHWVPLYAAPQQRQPGRMHSCDVPGCVTCQNPERSEE